MTRHRWRDIGDGRVRCDQTGEVRRVRDLRPIPGHAVSFSDEDWYKLQQLAKYRRKSPEQV